MDEGILVDIVCARSFEVEFFVLLYIQTVTPNYIHTHGCKMRVSFTTFDCL